MEIHKLYVELQFLPQLLKSSRSVLLLPVPVLNGLTQPLKIHIRVIFQCYCLSAGLCGIVVVNET